MSASRVIGARVPQPIFDGARVALGLPADVRESDVIRAALARLAGLNLAEHPVRPYRNREKQSAA